MTKFAGYVTTVIAPKDAKRLVGAFDFLLKNYAENNIDDIPPLNPLAAVGATLARMSIEDVYRFYDGELVINVVNGSRRTVEVYDSVRMDFEVNLERLAG
jgi:hypothetical protein